MCIFTGLSAITPEKPVNIFTNLQIGYCYDTCIFIGEIIANIPDFFSCICFDIESFTSANSQDKHGEQLNFMYFACKNSRNDFKVCRPLIGQKNTKVFCHQSEARTAAAVWNCSSKPLSPGALRPRSLLYFAPFFPPV